MRVFKVFVLLGGMGVEMTVEMKGGMTGGMKIEESLYLKGSAPFDGRDGELFAYSQQNQNTKQNCSMFINKNRLFFKHALLSRTFPYWELSVPLLGTDSE